MRVVAASLSALIGTAFILLSAVTLIGGDSLWLRAIGLFVLAYGIVTAVVTVNAWRGTAQNRSRFMAILGGILVVLWLLGSFDHGILSGLEMVGVSVVAFAAIVNWWAVRVLATVT